MSAAPPVLTRPSPGDLRDELERRLLLDLHGPAGGPEEIVEDGRVRERYILGTLAPRGEKTRGGEQDGVPSVERSGDGDDDATERDAALDALLPSSLGLTFFVDAAETELEVTARWGRYERLSREDAGLPAGSSKLVWRRVPVEAQTTISLAAGKGKPWSPHEPTPAVTVEWTVRRAGDVKAVTLFLRNGQERPKRRRDAAWLFQPVLEVRSPRGAAVFRARRPSGATDGSTVDERILQLLYRDVREFAVGHGVGVHAEPADGDASRSACLATRVVPEREVGRTAPPTSAEIPALAAVPLDMKVLADLEPEALPAALTPLADAYEAWIAGRRAEAGTLPPDDAAVAREALDRCARAARGIREGIAVLGADPRASAAFRLANRAMRWQRVRGKLAEEVRRGKAVDVTDVDVPRNRTWFPFQLAFFLKCLPSLTDVAHPDREAGSEAVADLLWFPTGGGKTEAYLGLAAYAMLIRRLQGPLGGRSGEHGVAVLMRYTLRLLTLQQFQRAAALVCALEELRREEAAHGETRLGSAPFRIGLWVGMRVTPNTTEQSRHAVQQAKGDGFWKGESRAGTPYQLVSCPWCGTPIEEGRDLVVETFDAGRGRTLTFCGDVKGRCLFSRAQSPAEGLPVLVVDEEMYREPPALLIATVDKLAQMPWKGEVQTFFGRVSGRCPRHGFRSPDLPDTDSHQRKAALPAVRTEPAMPLRPPDLVIQDELHLISGPLGTLVGLYETAVDALASWEVEGRVVRPKVIASTATVRRAREQVLAVFRREVEVFPPPGLDHGDSFFARYRPPSKEEPGRRYLGLCAQGRRMRALLIRVYTALLAAARSLHDEVGLAGESPVDPWMTLVGYFGSMRELGGMRRLVDDDVAERLQRMDQRGLARRPLRPSSVEELTSRKSSAAIPRLLDRLDVPFGSEKEPLDVVLATNMLSVGVDVRRLGLMVVCGQPKTTAEYIQATSRVGRHFPGLVVTVLNWARPRDLSHYERFEHYHATFYTQVESLSVTPFAGRALDRGLTGVLASLVRLSSLELNANERAGAVTPEHPVARRAYAALVERAHAVTSSRDVAEDVRARLLRVLDTWSNLAGRAGGQPLGYRERLPELRGLLSPPGDAGWDEFTCLTSLRDVEPMVPLQLAEVTNLDDVPEFGAAVAPQAEPLDEVDDADESEEETA